MMCCESKFWGPTSDRPQAFNFTKQAEKDKNVQPVALYPACPLTSRPIPLTENAVMFACFSLNPPDYCKAA